MELKLESNMIDFIVPTYNRSSFLKRVLNSLTSSNHSEFRVIIINDGSQDDTEKVVQHFLNESSLNIIYHAQENGGKVHAVNSGLQRVKSEIVCILDDDDIVLEHCVETVLKHWSMLSEQDAGLCFQCVDQNEKIIGSHFHQSPLKTDFFSLRDQYGVTGDKIEFFKLSMNQYF